MELITLFLVENMTSSVDSFASQKDKDDFGKAPGDRRARMFRNREMSFNSAFMELSDVAKYEEEEANGLLASEGTGKVSERYQIYLFPFMVINSVIGLTISDFTSNMSTSISSVTDSDEPGSESRYSMNSSQSPPRTCSDPCLSLTSSIAQYSIAIVLIIVVQLLEKKFIRDSVQKQKRSRS